MISLVTFAKIALSRVGFRTLGAEACRMPIQAARPPRRNPTFLTTHEPEMPRLSPKAAQSPPSRGLLLHQGDAKPINTHRADVGLAV